MIRKNNPLHEDMSAIHIQGLQNPCMLDINNSKLFVGIIVLRVMQVIETHVVKLAVTVKLKGGLGASEICNGQIIKHSMLIQGLVLPLWCL